MRCCGLTGGMASGKSTVLAMLVERGAAAIDADAIAREVVRPGERALAEIAARFGPGVLAGDGTLDRRSLGAIVFGDAARRRELERITHPRILATLRDRLAEARRHGGGVTIAVVPLLFEAGADLPLEGVLVVDAPEPVQLTRLMARDGLTEVEARARLGAQMDSAERRARATWIIDNGGTLEATAGQVERWWNQCATADLAASAS